MERGDVAAVVIKPCTSFRDKTMYAKICAALVLIQICCGAAFAAKDNDQPTGTPFDLFQGTPEEQAACAPDSTKFCRDAIPDTFRVLACLQDHRQKLRKVCLKVLEDHGK
jgi:hypothetical protein